MNWFIFHYRDKHFGWRALFQSEMIRFCLSICGLFGNALVGIIGRPSSFGLSGP